MWDKEQSSSLFWLVITFPFDIFQPGVDCFLYFSSETIRFDCFHFKTIKSQFFRFLFRLESRSKIYAVPIQLCAVLEKSSKRIKSWHSNRSMWPYRWTKMAVKFRQASVLKMQPLICALRWVYPRRSSIMCCFAIKKSPAGPLAPMSRWWKFSMKSSAPPNTTMHWRKCAQCVKSMNRVWRKKVCTAWLSLLFVLFVC